MAFNAIKNLAIIMSAIASAFALAHSQGLAQPTEINKDGLPLYLAAPDKAQASIAKDVVPQDMAQVKMSFAPVVERAAPAVVNIYSRRVVQTRSASPFANDPFFRQFFGDSAFGTRPRVQNSLGSGVIVRPEGVIVTNNHVVQGMSEIKVVLQDRREFTAEIMLTDPRTDLAILRIDAGEPLPFLTFTNSDSAAVGDIVLAIGNPFGVGQTVTNGIVSALARTQVGISDFQFFIQTDAAINPGNSGGALVDINGNLLGINTAIYSRSGGSNGIGFAIPGNLVKQVVATAIDGADSVMRPWLGAEADSVSADLAKALLLDKPSGALIKDIFPNGPADKAGLQAGDVITAFGPYEIYDAEGLRFRVATRDVGEQVEIHFMRQGEPQTTIIKTDLPPEDPPRQITLLTGDSPLSGAQIANLSPALNEELGLPHLERGVVVMGVDPSGYARRYGLRKGTKILSLNGERISSVADLQMALDHAAGRFVLQLQDPSGRISTWRIRW